MSNKKENVKFTINNQSYKSLHPITTHFFRFFNEETRAGHILVF